MILLDTTVLSYAVGEDHPLRVPCQRLLAAHVNGRIRAATTVEVVQEFLHVHARRRPRALAVRRARLYVAVLPLLMTRPEDLALGLALFERYPQVGAFDAVLAGLAMNHQVEALVSADRAYGTVPNLPWVDPATPAFEALISGQRLSL